MHTPTGTSENRWSGVEDRLLPLDPDLEELFAEVDEALRMARAHGTPRLRTIRGPRPRNPVSRLPDPRRRGRRPVPGRACQRGPPGYSRYSPAPVQIRKRGDARFTRSAQGLRRCRNMPNP